jgi:nucleoside-diphosphate-sugar epimerase
MFSGDWRVCHGENSRHRAAGFIGFHLARRLLSRGDEVVGLDNLNDYYTLALHKTSVDQAAF